MSIAQATLGAFSKEQMADIANLSRWAFLLTIAGVGLSTDLREMRKRRASIPSSSEQPASLELPW